MEVERGEIMVTQQAKEELQILESHYPNNFHTLKLDLKSFISQMEYNSQSFPTLSTVTTQASSSSRKKRKKGNYGVKQRRDEDEADGHTLEAQKPMCIDRSSCVDNGYRKRKERIDTESVIEKAQICLEKIQQFKNSIF